MTIKLNNGDIYPEAKITEDGKLMAVDEATGEWVQIGMASDEGWEEIEMMKGYFLETEDYNAVVLTDGNTAKVFGNGGYYEGVDLYADDAQQKLAETFAAADLNDYSNIDCDNIVKFSDVEEMLDDEHKIY